MDKSMSWALRCRHEADSWAHNAFLTLTYDDEHLPWHGSLDKDLPRLFVRYLRRHLDGVECAPGSPKRPIRYFGCGEYGERRNRAHYHLLLFNVRFDDTSVYGRDTYTSRLVSQLWPYGSHILGTVTPASASYVAGYALKKVSKWEAAWKYRLIDENGEFFDKQREFAMMSLKPPIGWYWYAKYKNDLRLGHCVVDGRQVAIPRLYRDKLRVDAPGVYAEMELKRHEKMAEYDPSDRSAERMIARREVALARMAHYKRDHLED